MARVNGVVGDGFAVCCCDVTWSSGPGPWLRAAAGASFPFEEYASRGIFASLVKGAEKTPFAS